MYELDKPCIVYREDCPLYQKGEDMTGDEAIKELSEMRTDAWTDSRQMEALEMAIKALGQETYYKDLAESYERTINKLTKAIAEQEPNCPFYKIDEDGHGLCKNHRYIPTMYYPQVDGITPTVVKAEQEPRGDLISRQAVQDKLVELCIGIAPDETVTDIDELHCREAQMDILDEIMEWMKKQQAPKGKCILSQKYKDWQFIRKQKMGRCTDCKHYMSGEYDGSCDSYICEHYSNWESDNCN